MCVGGGGALRGFTAVSGCWYQTLGTDTLSARLYGVEVRDHGALFHVYAQVNQVLLEYEDSKY